MSEKSLIEKMKLVYDEADPLDHRIVIDRDVIHGWINELKQIKKDADPFRAQIDQLKAYPLNKQLY